MSCVLQVNPTCSKYYSAGSGFPDGWEDAEEASGIDVRGMIVGGPALSRGKPLIDLKNAPRRRKMIKWVIKDKNDQSPLTARCENAG